jgi:cysteine desulfurase/selenocysteine lyase
LEQLLTERTRIVAVSHISNVLGTENPVGAICQRAHAVGALCLVDAAQSVAQMPVNVQAMDYDFLALSGHKAYGATGVGGAARQVRSGHASHRRGDWTVDCTPR